MAGNPTPLGKFTARKRRLCSASGCGQAPRSSSRRSGVFCSWVQAASNAFHCIEFLSGRTSSDSAAWAMASGRRPWAISSIHCCCCSACRRFFSSAARAAARMSGGAGR
ncbi:Uncharacterised protein [Bordetella pertussis]|nr:Uncharacterised protein [Bordetella pertussis]